MMQQTERYKLNLIETSDPFSPQPLNENAEKTEAALLDGLAAEAAARTAGDAVEAEARAAGDAALDARLRVFEARHFEISTYTGTGDYRHNFSLDFTPRLMVVLHGSTPYTVLPGTSAGSTNVAYLTIIDGGFQVGMNLNTENVTYHYLALD